MSSGGGGSMPMQPSVNQGSPQGMAPLASGGPMQSSGGAPMAQATGAMPFTQGGGMPPMGAPQGLSMMPMANRGLLGK